MKKGLLYLFLILLGWVMMYPLIWLLMGAFKTNNEIISGTSLLPSQFSLDGFVNGWTIGSQYSFTLFFTNTFAMVIPVVLFTVFSSSIVAYGFSRFDFPMRRVLFSAMISSMLLPNAVIIIPRYILFNNLEWINTYKPFTIPALLAGYPFFIFLMVQFIRGIPRELDEASKIDGCNSFMIFIKILLPLTKPALFSAAIFQFVWTWNDFMNVLIYISSVRKYTVALALRMTIDISSGVKWNEIMAMSVLVIIPPALLFFCAQNYFVEGVTTTGLKS